MGCAPPPWNRRGVFLLLTVGRSWVNKCAMKLARASAGTVKRLLAFQPKTPVGRVILHQHPRRCLHSAGTFASRPSRTDNQERAPKGLPGTKISLRLGAWDCGAESLSRFITQFWFLGEAFPFSLRHPFFMPVHRMINNRSTEARLCVQPCRLVPLPINKTGTCTGRRLSDGGIYPCQSASPKRHISP